MCIYNHNIFDNVRTRVVVHHESQIIMHPPFDTIEAWTLPGGGLEPRESLVECGGREVFEETGLKVDVKGILFLREWVVPSHCPTNEANDKYGFGIEVFLYATPIEFRKKLKAEFDNQPGPEWVNLEDIPEMRLWPKELKTLALDMQKQSPVSFIQSFVSKLESPDTKGPKCRFSNQLFTQT